jgi:hypothetical protein
MLTDGRPNNRQMLSKWVHVGMCDDSKRSDCIERYVPRDGSRTEDQTVANGFDTDPNGDEIRKHLGTRISALLLIRLGARVFP